MFIPPPNWAFISRGIVSFIMVFEYFDLFRRPVQCILLVRKYEARGQILACAGKGFFSQLRSIPLFRLTYQCNQRSVLSERRSTHTHTQTVTGTHG